MRASLPIEHTAPTPEQTAALARYRSRWAAIRRATGPTDHSAAEEGVRRAYHAAGLRPPARLVWCDSPVALSERASRDSRVAGANVKSKIVHRIRRQVAASVGRHVHRRVQALVRSMVDPPDALIESVADAVATAAAPDTPSLLDLMRRSYPLSWSEAVGLLLGRGGLRDGAVGPNELSWLGSYDYLRDMFDLQIETAALSGLNQVAASLGWFRPHEHICWLTERPSLLRGDARDRLHNADGPALRFPDGWSMWAWKGVEVPRALIERPEAITLAAIDAESNVQVRRVMIEIVTPERYVALGGAERIAEDETGILWRRTWLQFDAWAAVEVINATPEPDGTRRHFFLQVPANIRTAREAVAWTYGLRPRAYARLVTRT